MPLSNPQDFTQSKREKDSNSLVLLFPLHLTDQHAPVNYKRSKVQKNIRKFNYKNT
jgi:hypothetical protein